jgi:hypothetical protein
MNGALLLASVGYLHKLVCHTGRHRAVGKITPKNVLIHEI